MDTSTSHYIRLATSEELSDKLNEPTPVTIESLSAELFCTPRNVKFILRKLEAKGFIRWQPGIGRGHHSKLTLLRSVDEVLEERFLSLMERGKMKEAVEFIGTLNTLDNNEAIRQRLLSLLNKQMGFHSHTETNSGQDVLRMMRSRRMGNLDPASVYTAFETYLLGQIGSTLITFDAINETFQPSLAHMWECSEDHKVWIFYLRKGVRFHHGRTMTSQDVQATWQRLHDVKSPSIWLYRDIEHVELAGDYCIRFCLSRPNRFLLHLFSSIPMTILPFDIDHSKQLIGTGPFQVSEQSEDVLVLRAFDNYYGIRPHLDQVYIWFLPDLGTQDRYYELQGTDRLKMSSDYEKTKDIDYPALGCQYLLFNFQKSGIHHHPHFRHAMRIVYDSAALVTELGGSLITPASSFLPWISAGQHWTEAALDHAHELLNSSGYQGETILLSCTANKDRNVADWLQQRGAAIGLHIEIVASSDNLQPEETTFADLILAEEILEQDWQYGMIHYFKTLSNQFNTCMSIEQQSVLDQKLEHFLQLNDQDRVALLYEAEEELRTNYWILHGAHLNKRAQLNQSLFGLQTSDFGFMDISKIWIKQ
ncbi:ABC transporter substrate-binding protein [Paenibacillus xylanilyticus]|uniref:ABC transporter substrate-binding protein n=1 Tax=Paenibacillus xylanilyticus TaxID=248903 RepID=UPI0039A3D0A2